MFSINFLFFFIPLLSIILIIVNLLFAPHAPYKEKKTPFECGYHSFLLQNRAQFTVSFFIFAILFMVFDLEIVLLYPFSVSIGQNEFYGLLGALGFVGILTAGFAFELGKGALKIESRQNAPDPFNNLQILQSKSINNPLHVISPENIKNINHPEEKNISLLKDAYIKNCELSTKIINSNSIINDSNIHSTNNYKNSTFNYLQNLDLSKYLNIKSRMIDLQKKLDFNVPSSRKINHESILEDKCINEDTLTCLSNKSAIIQDCFVDFETWAIAYSISNVSLLVPIILCFFNPILHHAKYIIECLKKQRDIYINICLWQFCLSTWSWGCSLTSSIIDHIIEIYKFLSTLSIVDVFNNVILINQLVNKINNIAKKLHIELNNNTSFNIRNLLSNIAVIYNESFSYKNHTNPIDENVVTGKINNFISNFFKGLDLMFKYFFGIINFADRKRSASDSPTGPSKVPKLYPSNTADEVVEAEDEVEATDETVETASEVVETASEVVETASEIAEAEHQESIVYESEAITGALANYPNLTVGETLAENLIIAEDSIQTANTVAFPVTMGSNPLDYRSMRSFIILQTWSEAMITGLYHSYSNYVAAYDRVVGEMDLTTIENLRNLARYDPREANRFAREILGYLAYYITHNVLGNQTGFANLPNITEDLNYLNRNYSTLTAEDIVERIDNIENQLDDFGRLSDMLNDFMDNSESIGDMSADDFSTLHAEFSSLVNQARDIWNQLGRDLDGYTYITGYSSRYTSRTS